MRHTRATRQSGRSTPFGRFLGTLLMVLLILAAMGVAGWIEGGMR